MLSDVLDGEADRNSLHFVLHPTPHGDSGILEALLLTLHTSCIFVFLFFYYGAGGGATRLRGSVFKTYILNMNQKCRRF
jgi:hypothetical protein